MDKFRANQVYIASSRTDRVIYIIERHYFKIQAKTKQQKSLTIYPFFSAFAKLN